MQALSNALPDGLIQRVHLLTGREERFIVLKSLQWKE